MPVSGSHTCGGIWIHNRSNVAPLGSFDSFLPELETVGETLLASKPAASWRKILSWLRFPISRPRYQTCIAKNSWIYVELLLDSERYIFSFIAGSYDSQRCAGGRRRLGPKLYSIHQRLPSLPHLCCQHLRYRLTSAWLSQPAEV